MAPPRPGGAPSPTVTGSRRGDLLLLGLLVAAILAGAPRLVVYERVPRWAIERAADAETTPTRRHERREP